MYAKFRRDGVYVATVSETLTFTYAFSAKDDAKDVLTYNSSLPLQSAFCWDMNYVCMQMYNIFSQYLSCECAEWLVSVTAEKHCNLILPL